MSAVELVDCPSCARLAALLGYPVGAWTSCELCDGVDKVTPAQAAQWLLTAPEPMRDPKPTFYEQLSAASRQFGLLAGSALNKAFQSAWVAAQPIDTFSVQVPKPIEPTKPPKWTQLQSAEVIELIGGKP